MTPEILALAKQYCAIVPDKPRDEPVEAVNAELADLFCQYCHILRPLPDTLTEADAVQFLDKHLIP